MKSKVLSMKEAVAAHVHDGDTVVIEGFTHLISFAAGHEIIRQGRKDLTLARLTPDLVYAQMVAAGVAAKLIFTRDNVFIRWLHNQTALAMQRRLHFRGQQMVILPMKVD